MFSFCRTYRQAKTGIVGIKYSDLCFLKGEYFIDSKRYLQIMREEGVLTEQHTLDDLAAIVTEFQFSLYENDYLEYEKNHPEVNINKSKQEIIN